jgi:hypothetical protein
MIRLRDHEFLHSPLQLRTIRVIPRTSGGFQNNRRQDLSYDADGKVTHTPSYNYAGGSVVSFPDWTYDAAGQMAQVKETVTANNSVSTYISSHDGDGQPVVEYYQENVATKSFMVRSSVLGGKVLTRLDNAGNKSSTVFSVDGLLTAVQNVSPYGSSLRWTHIDPLGLSEAGDTKAVYDPMGNYIQWQHAPTYPPPGAIPPIAASFGGLGPSFGYAINSSCILDGIPTDCSLALNMLNHGSADLCPNNYCGPSRARNGDLVPLTRDPDTGALGYYSLPPQNSGPVRLGGIDEIKKLIEQTSSSCREAVKKLLTEISAETKSELTSTDPMESFNQITSQKGGGGLYADITHGNMQERLPADSLRGYTPIASGSGEAWRFWSYSEKSVQRIAIIYLRYSTGTPQSTGLVMAAYLVTAFHEMTHIARKDGTMVSHDQMNSAAVALHAASFDDYIEKHCVDKKYWGRP